MDPTANPNPVPTPPAEPFVEQFPVQSTDPVVQSVPPVIPDAGNQAPPPPTPDIKPKRNVLPVVLLIVVLIALGAGAVFLLPTIQSQLSKNTSPTPTGELTMPPVSPTPIAVETNGNLAYLKDNDLWLGESKISTSGAVIKYAHAGSKLFYINGTKQVINGQDILESKSVVAHDVATNTSSEILNLVPSNPIAGNADYKLRIVDIALSDDKALLAITTTNSVYVYNAAGGNLDKVYENVLTNVNANSVWGYSNPIFSPDNTQLLLILGHYEGSSQAILNVTNKSFKELEYSAYISGERAIDWIDNANLLVIEYTDQTADTVETTFNKVPVSTFQKTQIAKLPYGWVDIKIAGNQAYMIGTSSVKAGMGQNNVELFDRFSHVIKVDLTTGQNSELYKMQTQKAAATETESKNLSGLFISPDAKTLWINMSIWRQPPAKSQYDVYSLDVASKAFSRLLEGAIIY